jgi:hypothetical protein
MKRAISRSIPGLPAWAVKEPVLVSKSYRPDLNFIHDRSHRRFLRSIYLRDPDSNLIEISEYVP